MSNHPQSPKFSSRSKAWRKIAPKIKSLPPIPPADQTSANETIQIYESKLKRSGAWREYLKH